MEPFLIYLGKVALAMGAFYLMFLVLFQRQKHFRFNRLYLLASMGISYLIPLITFTVIEQVEAIPVQTFTEPLYAAAPSYSPVVTKNPYEWYHYLFVLLLIGSAGFFIHFVIGSFKALNIIRKSYRKNELGQNVCITRDDVHPFSFFNKVVISEKNLSHPNLNMILSHEKMHVKERHTFDILIAEILFLLEWLNPFAWLLKDAVKSNLEFLTDDYIVKENDREAYQLAMVSLADKQGVAPFLTALNGSQLKNRIIMMKKKTTNRFAVVRQLLILPLLALLVMGLSNKEVKTEFVEKATVNQSGSFNKGIHFENNLVDTNDVLINDTANYTLVIRGLSSLSGETPIIKIVPKSSTKDSSKIITGKVTNENGKPIIGAMFIEYDLNGEVLQGTTTNANGEFKFETKSGNSVIKCSARGFIEKEVDLEEGEELTIVLKKEQKNQDGKENLHISGKVSDENRNPIPGTSVILYHLKNDKYIVHSGVATDEDGKYSLNIDVQEGKISFVQIGYVPYEINISEIKRKKINVTLKEDKTGFKGEITVRGEKDKEPLYVVDGKITKNIDDISPDDINSVTVLKDEKAKELYGEKGEDGVIFIDVQARNENQDSEKNYSLNNGDEALEVINLNTGKKEWRIVDYKPKAMIIVDGNEVSKPAEQIDPSSIENVTILKGEVAREVYGEKGKNGVIEITTHNAEGAVYNIVDEIPQFPGGPKALHQYLKKYTHYPKIALDNGIQGIVLVTITIDETGKVTNPRILQGVDRFLNEEAIRVAGTLPFWKPGKVDGKPVKTNYTLPVNFNLGDQDPRYKTVTIPGTKNMSNEAPLFIIDGKEKGTKLNDLDIDPEDIEIIKIFKEDASGKFGEKAKNGAIEIITKKYAKNHPELKEKTDSESSSEVFTKEELFFKGGKSPEFPGGETGLSKYVAKKVNYPVVAQQNGIQGKVFVIFTIDKKGNVQNPFISKGVDPVLDDEALRVVKTFPKWEPGKLNGKPVEVLYTAPITFKLQ